MYDIWIKNRELEKEEFDPERIRVAVSKADVIVTDELLNEIIDECKRIYYTYDYYLGVEEIQDSVEKVLCNHGMVEQAGKYIAARLDRRRTRDITRRCKDFIKKYSEAYNTANATIDDNANVGNKNVAVLNSEIHKPTNIDVNRSMVVSKLKQLFPSFKAKDYIKDLKSHIIYKHDESTFAGAIAPYCASISMYPFLQHGLKEIGGKSDAPTNLDSFCGGYINLIFGVAAQFAGAVATSEFLVCFDHFARLQFGEDYAEHLDEFYTIGPDLRKIFNTTGIWAKNVKELKSITDECLYGHDDLRRLRDNLIEETTREMTDEELKDWQQQWEDDNHDTSMFQLYKLGDGTRTIGGTILQYFQQVIYSINQPAASRGNQTAFVNFSYFDSEFFKGMFSEMKFPLSRRQEKMLERGEDVEFDTPKWESVKVLQKMFMMWFNNERLKNILTFPVESFALVQKDGEFVDEDSAKFVAKMYSEGHSFFTYISDSVDSLSSCCFLGNEQVNVRMNGMDNTLTIKELVDYNSNNVDENGAPTKSNIYIESYNIFTQQKELTRVIGTLKKIYTGTIYKFKVDNRLIAVTPDHTLCVKNNNTGVIVELPAEQLYKNINEYAIAVCDEYGDMTFRYCTDAYTIDVASQYVYDIELEKNHYFSTNGIITHNCRLKNVVSQSDREFSFTNGNMGVMTGSKSVITLNVNRITQDFCKALDYKQFETTESFTIDFKKYINRILERVYKYHIAYNECIWDVMNSNLLTVYKAGMIDLNKQYLTIGINGLNEAAEFLGLECTVNDKYAKFCQLLFGTIKESNLKNNGIYNGHEIKFNTECVPAEGLGPKNYNWDKDDGYWVPEEIDKETGINKRNLYASYIFIPSHKYSITDRIKMHGADYIGDYLDGGSACHINLVDHPDEKQAYMILKMCAKYKCQYFTFNIPYVECRECHHIVHKYLKTCPKCGSNNMKKYDRIIGYLVAVDDYSRPRWLEEKFRVRNNDM